MLAQKPNKYGYVAHRRHIIQLLDEPGGQSGFLFIANIFF
jgi:hypothetical protein